MISSRVANELNLTARGLTQVAGVDGVSDHEVYYFHVGIKSGDTETEYGHHIGALHVFPEYIEGGEVNLEGFDFDVLLGMDVISRGSLAVEGSGTFSFSF